MIKIEKLYFSYLPKAVPPRDILSDLSLEINRSKITTIIGPSGCGKTTLLKLIADLISDYRGKIDIFGHTPRYYRLKRKYSYFFQDSNLLPWRTVAQNIALPLELMRRVNQAQVEQAMKLVGIEEQKGRYPDALSGGMRQRVSLARGLVTDPELLIMDEPFASLDEIVREQLAVELLKIWQQMGKTIIFVTHSISEAVFLSDKIYVLNDSGQVKGSLNVKIAYPREAKVKETEEFFKYEKQLRSMLRN